MNLEGDYPAQITNSIIDVDDSIALSMDYKKVFEELNDFNCSCIQIRSFSLVNITTLEKLLDYTYDSRIKEVRLVLKYDVEVEKYLFDNLLYKHKRICQIIFFNASRNDIETNLDVQIVYLKSSDLSANNCGQICKGSFTVNIPHFTESLHYNSCLNRKISLDTEGNIKNCPSQSENFGNISQTTLKEAIKNKRFQSKWKLKKDDIKVCRDCEHRYICTDCRIFIEDNNDNSQNLQNVLMIHIMQLGISIIMVVSTFCYGQPSNVYFSDIKPLSVKGFNSNFSEYCSMDSSQNFERNAVVSSFFGDHKSSIAFATKDATPTMIENSVQADESQMELMKNHLTCILADSGSSSEDRLVAKKMLNTLTLSTNVNEVFKGAEAHSAKAFILDSAKHYHFLLINEAHYSSQNRAFTRSLLEPLWKQGYRYLGLETLGYEDTTLMKRKYPLLETGYYTKDPVFGNLVREALEIGYELISYETTAGNEGTLRDRDQAINIYQKTWQKDSVGKVLVHAGYGHIGELGGSTYNPMGAQLKEVSGQDILTVEQQVMTELIDEGKLHPYYKYVISQFKFEEPLVFKRNKQVLADPVNNLLVDIQVYHPKTKYIHDRPSWLLTGSEKIYKLPTEFNKYYSHLLQAVPINEDANAIPVDQFVISPEKKSLVLPPGEYELRIVDCEGTLVGKASLKIDSRG